MVALSRSWEVAKLNTLAIFKAAFAVALAFSTLSGSLALAQGHKGADTFNVNTGHGGASSSQPISGNAALGLNGPIPRWFDDVDAGYFQYADIPIKDSTIISRPFNNDAKRVEEWSHTIAAVAKRYHEYAKQLRSTNVPSGIGQASGELQSFRDALANYYDDSAEYFADWIRPRRPAVTREELQQQLDQMHQRSVDLKNQINELVRADQTLRTRYDVRPRDDKLMQYVAKQPQK